MDLLVTPKNSSLSLMQYLLA